MKNTALWLLSLLSLLGCASPAGPHRLWIDSSSHTDDLPSWAEGTRVIWENDGKVLVHSSQTVRGDERVNGCMDLAKLDAKEIVLSELASDVRVSVDNAQQTLSENAEVVLGKVRTGELQGRVVGMRHTQQYFERYRVAGTERIDCHVLSEMSIEDYNRVKRGVVDKIQQADARIKEAVTKKQAKFFDE
ncbi:hypothetical protein K2X33_11880 [bacterium]|nr:hypothetical protein [bacterium]